jgi:tRNA-specific 2-thiouridylase
MSSHPTVVVGMSGGVDSSVSAFLLKEQGYRVIGMFMKNWEEPNNEGGVCPAAIEFEDVVRVCDQLDIPYYSVNFVQEYRDHVFSHFLREFQAGHTPNPDILCNREIKFKVLLDKAIELGADFLATGHYCQNVRHQNGEFQLLKGLDPGKDQSYFLHAITEKALQKVLFPVGNLHKSEVRRIAKAQNLATSEKKDSTGICFIGERDFKQFLLQYLPGKPGDFEDLSGKKVGRHDGVAYYTPGQRKGLGIGGPGEAWFVVDKDIERNVVILAQGDRHPALYCDELVAVDLHWISPNGPPVLPLSCKAKIRYRQADQECMLSFEDGKAIVRFAIPQRAVSIGQSVVFYDNDVCLGGGTIHLPGHSYYARGVILPDQIGL